ncbi:hypothetical protein [Desulfovulcanus sp.]
MGSSPNDRNRIFFDDDNQDEMEFDRMHYRLVRRKPRSNRADCEELKRKSDHKRQRRKARREKHRIDENYCR